MDLINGVIGILGTLLGTALGYRLTVSYDTRKENSRVKKIKDSLLFEIDDIATAVEDRIRTIISTYQEAESGKFNGMFPGPLWAVMYEHSFREIFAELTTNERENINIFYHAIAEYNDIVEQVTSRTDEVLKEELIGKLIGAAALCIRIKKLNYVFNKHSISSVLNDNFYSADTEGFVKGVIASNASLDKMMKTPLQRA